MTDTTEKMPEQLAQLFHETYERLAPDFGYKTREASAKPWSEVPDQNKNLMIAVCAEIQNKMSAYPVTNINNMPERIWAHLYTGNLSRGEFYRSNLYPSFSTEYIRRDAAYPVTKEEASVLLSKVSNEKPAHMYVRGVTVYELILTEEEHETIRALLEAANENIKDIGSLEAASK